MPPNTLPINSREYHAAEALTARPAQTAPEGMPAGPAYCAKQVRCKVCLYPQPCDARTLQHF